MFSSASLCPWAACSASLRPCTAERADTSPALLLGSPGCLRAALLVAQLQQATCAYHTLSDMLDSSMHVTCVLQIMKRWNMAQLLRAREAQEERCPTAALLVCGLHFRKWPLNTALSQTKEQHDTQFPWIGSLRCCTDGTGSYWRCHRPLNHARVFRFRGLL